jgi:hypothetical protein
MHLPGAPKTTQGQETVQKIDRETVQETGHETQQGINQKTASSKDQKTAQDTMSETIQKIKPKANQQAEHSSFYEPNTQPPIPLNVNAITYPSAQPGFQLPVHVIVYSPNNTLLFQSFTATSLEVCYQSKVLIKTNL